MTKFIREMKEYKSRVESYSREMLRKESQIKELQGRIEIGDGCKYLINTLLYAGECHKYSVQRQHL
jgi:hypothetical protein